MPSRRSTMHTTASRAKFHKVHLRPNSHASAVGHYRGFAPPFSCTLLTGVVLPVLLLDCPVIVLPMNLPALLRPLPTAPKPLPTNPTPAPTPPPTSPTPDPTSDAAPSSASIVLPITPASFSFFRCSMICFSSSRAANDSSLLNSW